MTGTTDSSSHLKKLLDNGTFTVTGEITPPHGADGGLVLERASIIRDHCDAVNITDNVRGIPTMSSMVCAHILQQNGIEPIMQMSARDRNRILFESELFGASALGIQNILFMTGDHTLLGSHPQAKMVYDIDSIQALSLAKHLMSGLDLAGDELEGAPIFHLGSTFNPYADPMDLQAIRAEKKRDAGAEFFQTQALFDLTRFREFMEKVEPLGLRVIAGVIPLKGPRMASFMNKRVPGIRIPEELIQRLVHAGNGLSGAEKRQKTREEGLAIAKETVLGLKKMDSLSGVHLMGIGWEESIPVLVEATGLYPRPKR